MDKSLTQGCNPNNSDDSGGLDVSPEFLRLLEATVLAAGKYVVPSEDLRPHTLEAAKAMDSERKGSNRFLVVSAVIAFCFVFAGPFQIGCPLGVRTYLDELCCKFKRGPLGRTWDRILG